MDGSYEYQSNEDVEKTHVYTIFGLTTGIVAKDKKYIYSTNYMKGFNLQGASVYNGWIARKSTKKS